MIHSSPAFRPVHFGQDSIGQAKARVNNALSPLVDKASACLSKSTDSGSYNPDQRRAYAQAGQTILGMYLNTAG